MRWPRTPLFADVDRAVHGALGTRYSAAVVRIEQSGRLRHERAFGRMTVEPESLACSVDTAFDLASLTKLFTAVVALDDVSATLPALDASLLELVPEWTGTAHAPITLRRILAHDAGFKSGADYRTLLDRDVAAFAMQAELAAPPGERVIYSDLGFITLGALLARAARRSLAAHVESRVRSWGANAIRYSPPQPARAAIPATERELWRGLVQGTVHDEKAHLLGGAAGHAGLFGDARDVALLGEWHLAALHGRATPLHVDRVRESLREQAADPVLRRGLGWALKTRDDNSCGVLMSRDAFGHTGFTGTSIWIDPQRDCSVTLLTNAVHYGRSDLKAIRADVADAALRALDGAR